MRMKNLNHWSLTFFVVLLIFSIIISGCQNIGGLFQGNKVVNYRIGYDGVVIEPYKSNPDQVYEKDPFELAVTIKNMGSKDIVSSAPLRVTVTYNDYYIEPPDRQPLNGYELNFPLHKRDKYYPNGDMNYGEFYFVAKNLDSLREEIETDINFNICYPYSTEMTTDICIDTKTSSQDISISPCTLSDYVDRRGQGAPIGVVRIAPEMLTYDIDTVRPQFRIYLENKGQGYSVNPTRPNICTDTTILNSTNINRVKVSARLSERELECENQPTLVIEGRENVAKCHVRDVDLPDFDRNQKNYVALLTVKVDYGYIQIHNEKIKIKRIEEITQPIERCGPYEVMNSDGTCESLCSYCARGGTGEDCTDEYQTTVGRGFSCSCTLSTCNTLSGTGRCGFGFCTGSQYCCNIDSCWNQGDGVECGDNNVCIGGQCSGNTTQCYWQYGQYNSNYTCRDEGQCNQTTIIRGLCDGEIRNVCCKRPGT